jgi:Family of unknown function (DUF5994)
MAFPLSMNAYSPSASTVRFTRRRDLRRRHNPNVDAAWWPRSSNLAAELPHLLQLAQDSGFRATAVSYRLNEGWTALPDQLAFRARKVKVSGYHNHHQDMITLVDGISHERLQVMVVPAGTPPLLARRALRIAAVHAEPIQGTDLLALARGNKRTAVVTR